MKKALISPNEKVSNGTAFVNVFAERKA